MKREHSLLISREIMAGVEAGIFAQKLDGGLAALTPAQIAALGEILPERAIAATYKGLERAQAEPDADPEMQRAAFLAYLREVGIEIAKEILK